MMTYTKLFGSILDSTVWQEPLAVKVVWITMLAMSDKDGKVEGSIPGLAVRAGVSLEECEAALEKFKSPDKYSRTREHEGRRIKESEGGWLLLNHAKYRSMMSGVERREYQRVKQREYRLKKKEMARVRQENDSREERFVEADADGRIEEADEIAGEGFE